MLANTAGGGGISSPSGIGVIDQHGLWLSGRQLPVALADLPGRDTASRLAEQHGLRQLWIHETGLGPLGYDTTAAGDDEWQTIKVGRHSFALTSPAWLGAPFAGLADGPTLLAHLEAYLHAVGVAWHRSGALTSDRILWDHWKGRLRPTILPEGFAAKKIEDRYSWARAASADERRMEFCHAFDANAAYLPVASRLMLPQGEPHHAAHLYHGKMPAFYLIRPPAPRPGWPDPFRPQDRRRQDDTIWVTAPTAAFAFDLDADTEVLEMWGYEESAGFLSPWYERLRDARTAWLDRRGPVYDAIQLTYKMGVGRLGSVERRKRGWDDPLCQPYWRWAVVAEARTRLTRKLLRAPRPPVAIREDCIVYLTDIADPAAAADQLGLVGPAGKPFIGTGLGQFKVEASCAGPAAIDALEPGGNKALENLFGSKRVTGVFE